MTILLWTAVVMASLVVLVLVGWGLHRVCILLEDSGYLYYRKSSSGSGNTASAFLEFDRLMRPSVEHVIELRSSQTKVEESNHDGD